MAAGPVNKAGAAPVTGPGAAAAAATAARSAGRHVTAPAHQGTGALASNPPAASENDARREALSVRPDHTRRTP